MTASALSAPRARIGRPPTAALTAKRVKQICELVAKGVPQQAAAGSVGIPRRTFQMWLAKGREADAVEPYASMAARLEEALDQYHASRALALEDVLADEKADPRTRANVVMWELERRFKDEWGLPERGGTTVNVQVTLELERRELSARMLDAAQAVLGADPELLERFAAALRSAGGEVVDGEALELPEAAA